MNIAIFGTGYVGLVTGVCLAELGHNVICVDIDKDKIRLLNNSISPIHEQGLDELLNNNIKTNKIVFTTDDKFAIKKSKVIFIAVGTPEDINGNPNMKYVNKVAKTIGSEINQYKVVVNKSTVPIGTGEKVSRLIKNQIKKRKLELNFDVVSNPEFLKEGKAVHDFMNPDRIVIGSSSSRAIKIMKGIYEPLTLNNEKRMIIMDLKSSEMTKYAANSMLATKISFINEMSIICERVGADINSVRLGIGSDDRIGYKFIYPGVGYGGSCFPKDVKALEKIASKYNYSPKLIKAVQHVNIEQKKNFLNRILKIVKKGQIVTIWGLSFKPGTDDTREAPSIFIVKELLKKGIKIQVHDPIAINNFKKSILGIRPYNIKFYEKPYNALNDSSALVLLTEWNEYKHLNYKSCSKKMRRKIIFDGRNIYNSTTLLNKGFKYFQIGV